MPLIQSTMPSATPHALRKPEASARTQALVISVPTKPQADTPRVGQDEKVVTPAAPPSAVQLQIKAIITEQAETLKAALDDANETPA